MNKLYLRMLCPIACFLCFNAAAMNYELPMNDNKELRLRLERDPECVHRRAFPANTHLEKLCWGTYNTLGMRMLLEHGSCTNDGLGNSLLEGAVDKDLHLVVKVLLGHGSLCDRACKHNGFKNKESSKSAIDDVIDKISDQKLYCSDGNRKCLIAIAPTKEELLARYDKLQKNYYWDSRVLKMRISRFGGLYPRFIDWVVKGCKQSDFDPFYIGCLFEHRAFANDLGTILVKESVSKLDQYDISFSLGLSFAECFRVLFKSFDLVKPDEEVSTVLNICDKELSGIESANPSYCREIKMIKEAEFCHQKRMKDRWKFAYLTHGKHRKLGNIYFTFVTK